MIKFPINPMPKVRMTGRSKFGNPRAKQCLEYQNQIANLARFTLPKFGKGLIGFKSLVFNRCGRPCDLDNLQKAFFDGLQYGEIFKNDNQIRALDGLRVNYVKDLKDSGIEFEIYALE